MLAALNDRLAVAGISMTREGALALAEMRSELLAEVDRVEFGTPAVLAIAEAVATSPHITQGNSVDTLARLQGALYALRDELPIEVPDAEIAEALRGCLDEWGDAAEVAAMSAEEVMVFSERYRQALESMGENEYRIVDDAGHTYAFDPAEWEHDELAPGWDGERWFDDFDD